MSTAHNFYRARAAAAIDASRCASLWVTAMVNRAFAETSLAGETVGTEYLDSREFQRTTNLLGLDTGYTRRILLENRQKYLEKHKKRGKKPAVPPPLPEKLTGKRGRVPLIFSHEELAHLKTRASEGASLAAAIATIKATDAKTGQIRPKSADRVIEALVAAGEFDLALALLGNVSVTSSRILPFHQAREKFVRTARDAALKSLMAAE